MLWRPRSILQLVLLGLFTIIAPLCGAIVYTVQTLDKLAQENESISRTVVSLTRASQVLQSDFLDLERRAHQYITLAESSLFDLFVSEHELLLGQLDDLELIVVQVDTPHGRPLRNIHGQLREILKSIPTTERQLVGAMAVFDELNITNIRFQNSSSTYVDLLLQQHWVHTEEIKDSLLLMVSLLMVATIVFSLLFIYWISTPIKQIETEIRQLGAGDLTHKIKISGPMEMQTLGLQLEWLRSRLNELEMQKQQFLRHMSHELKTPLASLCEGADLMAEGVVGKLDAKQQEIIGIIQQNSRDLQRLIENLLDYNQIMNIQELRAQAVSLPVMLDELLRNYRVIMNGKSLKFCCEGSSDVVYVDASKLRTVLDNLISNAVNYTPEGGEIEIHWYRSDALLNIEVANSGQKIPDTEASKIFQPFYQGSSARHGPIKGSGIGLSVARECAYAHGGDLCLVKHQDFPVCFRVTCPVLDEETV